MLSRRRRRRQRQLWNALKADLYKKEAERFAEQIMRIVEGAFDFLHSTTGHVLTMDGSDTVATLET